MEPEVIETEATEEVVEEMGEDVVVGVGVNARDMEKQYIDKKKKTPVYNHQRLGYWKVFKRGDNK